jgi:hypothetical protein
MWFVSGDTDSPSESGRLVTADQWNATSTTNTYTANQSDAMTTSSGQTWDITGIQLEVGSQASDFEHRSYGEELALCQRYFFNEDNQGSGTIGGVVSSSNANSSSFGFQTAQDTISFPVQMRIEPTLTFSASSHQPSETFISRSSVTFTGRYLSSGQYAYISGIKAEAEL